MSVSRRSFGTMFVAAAVSGLALFSASSAQADRSSDYNTGNTPPAPPKSSTPGTPGAPGKGDVRRALTPEDNAQRQKCVNWTMKGPTGKTWTWQNAKTGTRGTMKSTSKGQQVAGRLCRDFNETITLKDGRSETIDGRACQRADGSWEVVG